MHGLPKLNACGRTSALMVHACTLLCAGLQLLDVRLTNSTGTSIVNSQGGAPTNRNVTRGALAVKVDNE